MRFLYSLVFYLATPAILLHFAWRGRQDRRWLSRWRERFGIVNSSAPGGCILVHAASVGEVNAAAPLIQSLLNRNEAPVFVTTFTPTGSERLRDLFGERIFHAYLPLDLPGACKRFLSSLSPRLMLIMETELWPNLFHAAGASQIPLVITNARISTRSFKTYRRFRGVSRGALEHLTLVLAASEVDAGRFVACGAKRESVRVNGNIKFDLDLPAPVAEQGRQLRERWGKDRQVIVAGSTHEADEAVIFDAFASVLKAWPSALLVLVPRHPERFDAACASARRRGLEAWQHSRPGRAPASTQCLVLDVMGELQAAYGAADLAIIGGSFSAIGGHNPLEAAVQGVPVLTGPDMSGQADANAALVAKGAARPVPDAAALGTAIIELLADENERRRMGEAGKAVVAENRGALERTLATVKDVLGRAPAGARHED